MRKSRRIALASILALSGVGALGVYGAMQHLSSPSSGAETRYSHLMMDADYSVDANLAGGSEDLFYGKVTVVKGQRDIGIGPETQYAVEVQTVFKGDVTGVIVVNQFGGTDSDGVLTFPEGDYLLEAGKRYLFATNYNPERKWNTLIPVYGDVPIPDSEAPAPGMPDVNGDGEATMSDRWELAVQNQADLSTPESLPEPTEMPAEDPAPEPSPSS
ncbi:hypothetical protein ACWD6R_36250 [Streptomyces sp. NPDC005151]